jgi:hypothetical protein
MAVTAQALGDVSVVCLSALGPVPFAAMLLGDLGAAVTRVDRPGRGASLTGLPLEDDPRTRGHRGIGIDLRSSAGRVLGHGTQRGGQIGGQSLLLRGRGNGWIARSICSRVGRLRDRSTRWGMDCASGLLRNGWAALLLC